MTMNETEKALNYYKTGALQTGKAPWPKPQYVPDVVFIPVTVRADFEPRTFVSPGEYPVECNKYGAVSVKLENGKLLGLRLNEFDVIKWKENELL
jgi:hypothetical protein